MGRNITIIPARTSLAVNLEPQKLRVAAYCRVSTDQAEQQTSYEAQVTYYTNFITNHAEYELAGIFADEGLSGTNTKKRDQFNKMIDACKAGQIDRIITKSISRFARNTLDCLNFVRLLKDLGIGVIFEKENINTLDSKGEVLLSILSSLAQDESRSISENSTWGIRRRFEQGKVHVNHIKFVGYDKDAEGNLIINEKQAIIIRRIYNEYLEGKGPNRIAKELEADGIQNWNGNVKWYETGLRRILSNEKYKGDALLQKTYTVDFLTKKRLENHGNVPQYYVENSHPAIIDHDTWEAVQLEIKRRRDYASKHGIDKVDYSTDKHPFAGRVVCGSCGKAYHRKVWNSPSVKLRRVVWQCSGRYEIKGLVGCENKHVDEFVLREGFEAAFNEIMREKEIYLEKWKMMIEGEDVLKRVTAKRLIEIIESHQAINDKLFYKMVEKIVVMGFGKVVVWFLDGTDI